MTSVVQSEQYREAHANKFDEFDAKINTDESNAHLIKK